MRNLAELNFNESGHPVTRSAPTTSVLDQFDVEVGFPLPDVLKRILSFANGGHPELNAFDGSAGQYAVNRFYHLTEEDRGPESLWYAIKHWRSILGDNAVPFANDAGGNQFFVDVQRDPAPVKICLHDQGFKILEIARSLEEFIDRLQIDSNMI